MIRYRGVVWKTGSSLVITIPAKATGLQKGDKVIITLEEGE